MLKARKNNRVVRIPDEKADEYKKLGYTITDQNGKTVYTPEDKDATIASLRKENQELKEQLESLQKQITEKGAEGATGEGTDDDTAKCAKGAKGK